MTNSIATHLQELRQQISAAEKQFHRTAGSVQLLAASKAQSIEKIKQAIASSQKSFAENYLQEALPKIQTLAHENLEWHFIGPIQSNKTRGIAENFSWVHSVCREKIADRLNEQRPRELPPLNVCIEVNISQDPAKSGVLLEELPALALAMQQFPRLKLRGLMAIPTYSTDFATQRQPFARLRLAFQQLQQQGLGLDTLSMGMSDDFVAAIAEGATILRIGTAIFGKRNIT